MGRLPSRKISVRLEDAVVSAPGSMRLFAMVFVPLLMIGLVMFASVARGFAAERLEQREDAVFVDSETGSMWQLDRSKRLKDIESAQGVIASLNEGEFHDWRFPTRQELFELFQIFDLKNNGDVQTRIEGSYWIEEDGRIQVGTWEIGDGCGPSRKYYSGKAGYVRAVRP